MPEASSPVDVEVLLGPTIGIVAVVALAFAIVLRVVSNSFTGKYPPIYEGIPFVGGLLKFLKVG